jgi:hypothetical protein
MRALTESYRHWIQDVFFRTIRMLPRINIIQYMEFCVTKLGKILLNFLELEDFSVSEDLVFILKISFIQ